ncbi:MAG: hypothetical protein AAGP08_16125 [Pseudomonadota bacterium]
MQNLKTPAEITFGWIRDLQYLADFGRYEALVVLRLSDPTSGPRDVEVITSVEAHPDEATAALQERLVFDAARLMRLADLGFKQDDALALAA